MYSITNGTKVEFTINATENPISGTAAATEAPNENGWFTAIDTNGSEWFLNVSLVTAILELINFHVIDVENGSEPTHHETLDNAIEAARKLTGEWLIEDFTGEVVWAHDNERTP